MSEPTTDCYRKAADLLARRPHFRRELEAKLSRRSYDREVIESVLERLSSQGYLDDVDCARRLAAGALRRRGYGPRRARAELERRGASPEAVEEALAESFGEGDLELARRVAAAWRARSRDREGAALARHLDRKGFTAETIRTVLEEGAVVPAAGDEDATSARPGT